MDGNVFHIKWWRIRGLIGSTASIISTASSQITRKTDSRRTRQLNRVFQRHRPLASISRIAETSAALSREPVYTSHYLPVYENLIQ
jgi:hypothetical protein